MGNYLRLAGISARQEDLPKQTPRTTQQLLRRAEVAGPHIGTLCQTLHRTEREAAMRRILGLLALAKKYGAASADDSCAMPGKAVSAPTASSAATWNGICNCPWAGGK